MNQVSGFCQILIIQEETEFFGAFLDDLKKVAALCQECVRKLLLSRNPEQAAPRAVSDRELADIFEKLVGEIQLPDAQRPPAVRGDLLIVDDSPTGREVLGRLLRHHGHRVWEAANGRHALQLMEQQTFDLVLLDILMPEMNGLQVLQHLKDHPHLCRELILMISALEDIHGVVRCIEMGADDYLTKPIDRVLLQARISSALEKRQLRQPSWNSSFRRRWPGSCCTSPSGWRRAATRTSPCCFAISAALAASVRSWGRARRCSGSVP